MDAIFREPFREFSDSAKPICKLMAEVHANASEALRNKVIRDKNNAVQCASVVILSGYLESNLKNNALAFFRFLERRGRNMSHLPESFVSRHYEAGAKELERVAKGEKRRKTGFQDSSNFVRRLAEPATSPSALPIWEAFAVTRGNPGPEVIKEFLAAFEVKDPLGSVSKSISETYSAAILGSKLQSFIDIRNECAHTGSAKSVPYPSEINEYIQFLRHLTLGIGRVLEARAKEI